MEKEIKEERELVLKRVPPGDRWVFADGSQIGVYPSLTDALEAWFQANGDTQFYIDARKGTVEIIYEEEVEVPVKKFSLYGED
jgi:pectin methylesterase-like acyl-CoA thioesterase